MRKLKRNDGFSLVELIVVIAIMAVLIGVIAPMLIHNINKARRAKCITDRDALRTEIDIAVISDEYPDAKKAFEGYSDEIRKGSCKSRGEYEFQWVNEALGTYQITCTEHDKDTTVYTIADKLSEILDILGGKTGNKNTVDSNAAEVAPGSISASVAEAMKEAGINMGNMNATTWQYSVDKNKNSAFLYWTPESLENHAVGDIIPVFRYNVNTGTYTIWTTSVQEGSTSSSEASYKVLGNGDNSYVGYTPSTGQQGGASTQTYENAMEKYEQYLKEHSSK